MRLSLFKKPETWSNTFLNSTLGVFGQTECVQKRAIRMAKELDIASDVQWELSGLTQRRKE